MLVAALGVLDIIVGLSILFKEFFAGLALVLGVIVLLKGLFSVLGSLMHKFFLDILGWVDLLAGVVLLFSIDIPLIWLAIIIKGVYSIVMGWK